MVENFSKKSCKSDNLLNPGSDLPPNWFWVKLGDVAKSYKGKKPKNQTTEKNEKFSIPYVDIKAFEKRVIDNYTDGVKCTLCEPEDVLIVWDGARCGLVGRGIKGAIGSTLAKIKSEAYIDSFLFYFLQQYYKRINLNPKGVGIPHIEPNAFWDLDIPLPPLPEQNKIVEKIEELFSGLDSGVASLKKAKEQLRLYRQSVLEYAFSGRLTGDVKGETEDGKLSDGWKWISLKELTSILGDGLHGTPKYSEDGDFYFINGNNLSDGKIEIKANTKRVTLEEYEKYKKPLNDRTIFVSINGTLGKTAFFNGEKIILGKSACYLNLKEYAYKRYVRYYITTQRFLNYANKTATGSTIKNVSLQAMREFEIPLPKTVQEQAQIVEEIERRFSEVDNLEKAIDDSLTKAEILRQSILKQAFEGKLV